MKRTLESLGSKRRCRSLSKSSSPPIELEGADMPASIDTMFNGNKTSTRMTSKTVMRVLKVAGILTLLSVSLLYCAPRYSYIPNMYVDKLAQCQQSLESLTNVSMNLQRSYESQIFHNMYLVDAICNLEDSYNSLVKQELSRYTLDGDSLPVSYLDGGRSLCREMTNVNVNALSGH